MKLSKNSWFTLLFVLVVAVPAYAQESESTSKHPPSPDERAALHQLVTQYFLALAKNDWGANALSAKPREEERADALQTWLSGTTDVELESLKIGRITVTETVYGGNVPFVREAQNRFLKVTREATASVDVVVGLRALDSRTRKPVETAWNRHRILECLLIREGSALYSQLQTPVEHTEWQLVRDWPEPSHFLEALKTATTDDEIRTLVSLETRQGTRRVIWDLKKEAANLIWHNQPEKGFALFRLGNKLEKQIESKRETARTERLKRELEEAQQGLKAFPDAKKKSRELNIPPPPPNTDALDLERIARVYFSSGDYEKALEYYQKAMELYENDPLELYGLCKAFGDVYAWRGDYSQAVDFYLRSITYYESVDVRPIPKGVNGALLSLLDKGVSAGPPGRPTLFSGGPNDEVARSLQRIGDFYVLQGDYPKAIEYYRKSLKQIEAVATTLSKPHTWFSHEITEPVTSIAHVYEWEGDYDSLLKHYTNTIDEFESLGLSEEADDLLVDVSTISAQLGRLDMASKYLQWLQHFYETHNTKLKGGTEHIALAQYIVGLLYSVNGYNDLAVPYLEKARDTFKGEGNESSDIEEVFQLWTRVVYASQGGESLLDQPLEERRSSDVPDLDVILKYSTSVSDTLARLGDSYRFSSDNDGMAWECYSNALALADDPADRLLGADRLRQIGDSFRFRGKADRALVAYQMALSAVDRCCQNKIVVEDFWWGRDRETDSFDSPALDQLQRDRLEKDRAGKWLHHIGDEDSPAALLQRIGDVYEDQKQYEKALEAFRKSLISDSSTPLYSAGTLTRIAEAYRLLGDYDHAQEFIERAAPISKQTRDPYLISQTSTSAGRIYRAINRPEKALRAFLEAKNAVENMRSHAAGGEEERQFFLQDKLTPYHELVGLLVSQGRTWDALEMAESTKGRVLLELMRTGIINISKFMTPIERETNLKLQTRLNLLRQKLRQESNEARVKQLNNDLKKVRLDYGIFRLRTYAAHADAPKPPESRPVTSEEESYLIQDPKTGLLEFVVTDEQIYMFLLTRNDENSPVTIKPFAFPIKKKELEKKVADLRWRIEHRSINFRPLASELYDLLLKKAQNDLTGKSMLIIIPDGKLWELPFQVLVTPNDRYLLEDSAISYAPSLAGLREMMNKKDQRTETARQSKEKGAPQPLNDSAPSVLFAVGNPALSKQAPQGVQPASAPTMCARRAELRPIPEAEEEVNEIVKLYGADRTGSKSYVRSDATEENVKREAGKYKVLHLATHGVLNNSSPMDSYVVLARAKDKTGDYGSLSAREMMSLNLHADLVVLSACQTAEGAIGDGEGLIGMTWALAAAGTPTIVASQWEVNSCSTTDLMIQFHRELKDHVLSGDAKIGAPEALRRSSLALMKRDGYKDPFFWAGFIVFGDGR